MPRPCGPYRNRLSRAWAGAQVDVWALGCLTFELLNGSEPFASRDVAVVEKNILTAPVVFKVALSKAAQEFILATLERRAEMRPSSTQMLQSAWLLGMADDSVPGAPPGGGRAASLPNAAAHAAH